MGCAQPQGGTVSICCISIEEFPIYRAWEEATSRKAMVSALGGQRTSDFRGKS